MSARTLSVFAVTVIRLVSAPPVLRIDVVGPDPPSALLLRPSAGRALSSADSRQGSDGYLLSLPDKSEWVSKYDLKMLMLDE
jgi:hypothetical protein